MPEFDRHSEMPEADEAGPTIDEEIAASAAGVTGDERAGLVPDLLARRFSSDSRSYWRVVWDDFKKSRVALFGLLTMAGMALLGIFAPFISNHRPYVLATDAEGVSFPLFSSLNATDIVLVFGLLLVLAAMNVYRSARRGTGEPSTLAISLMLALALVVPLLGLIRADFERVDDQSIWWWLRVIGGGGIGLILAVRSFIPLYSRKRDEFGKTFVGSETFGALLGTVLLAVAGANLIGLSQRADDIVDYHQRSLGDDAWAIFPPIQHDHIRVQNYMVNQPPGAPFVRVQASGGSRAASDLGLSDTRRETNLAWENSAAAGADNPAPITRRTPLAHLRNGEGVRTHELPMTDFTIVAESMDRYSVSLYQAETIGDALDAMNEATGGEIIAGINDPGTRIVFDDNTVSRPLHVMGTDVHGSDVAARIIRATRVALSIGFVSTGIALLIGVTIGALMGYFGGWVDIAGMRTIEIFMAIPRLFLLLTIIAFIPPKWNDYMLYAMMAVIGATTWMGAARFIRAEFLRLRHQDFVQAAKACGLPLRSILFKHMLPNGVTPVLVDASFSVAAAILLETGLSFLGFGIKPPDPSWGQMLAGAVDTSTGVFHWWLAIFPGIMIFLTVFAFNVVGDALRDAIDPKLKKAAA